MLEWVPVAMFALVFVTLLLGYPVALTLAGVALTFAWVGVATGHFQTGDLGFLPGRMFGVITNTTLIAVPLFVFMGVVLERTHIAENLLKQMSALFGRMRGGLGLSVLLVGTLLAASTGIVGATVVTMGLLALPVMLQQGYRAELATGTLCATGTLGQIIPPSIALVLLGDVLSNAYQQAQLQQGVFAPKTVSVGDLFAGALVPGLILVGLYLSYLLLVSWLRPQWSPAATQGIETTSSQAPQSSLFISLAAPLLLIVAVLGSILLGIATPTEAAGVGAIGALLLAATLRTLNLEVLRQVSDATLKTTAMVFFILIGASIFSLVFRGYGGDELVQSWFENMPGGRWGAFATVMLVIFLLGFMLDFIEITFVVIPIVGPILLAMDFDPIWLGVMIAVNLQTSFLTPPFGFALFYLRGVTPPSVPTAAIYRGVVPFILLQILLLGVLILWPNLATWLPQWVYGNG
ncbi:MAG: TRAP transporter large permease [Pseudomonadales bacterium]